MDGGILNRYDRKYCGKNRDKRRYLRSSLLHGMIYKSIDDYMAHQDYHLVTFDLPKYHRRKVWQRYIRPNIWKQCQKRHANKRIRNIFDNACVWFDTTLPQNAQYKRIHELVIH